ncbi:hypothetical protein V8F06_000531 [Rhypophila decipiens]
MPLLLFMFFFFARPSPVCLLRPWPYTMPFLSPPRALSLAGNISRLGDMPGPLFLFRLGLSGVPVFACSLWFCYCLTSVSVGIDGTHCKIFLPTWFIIILSASLDSHVPLTDRSWDIT